MELNIFNNLDIPPLKMSVNNFLLLFQSIHLHLLLLLKPDLAVLVLLVVVEAELTLHRLHGTVHDLALLAGGCPLALGELIREVAGALADVAGFTRAVRV